MSIADNGPWTLATYIAGPIFGLIVVGLVVAAVFFFFMAYQDWGSYGAGDSIGFGIVALVAAAVIGGLTFLGFYPLTGEHHQWREVNGVVATVDSRLANNGNGAVERYLFTLDGSPQEFSIDDDRAASLQPGDDLTVACKREWVYSGTDGYDCRWIKATS